MTDSWLVLLPPLIVLGSVILVRNLIPAFLVGLLSAGLIASNFSLSKTTSLLFARFFEGIRDIDTIYNFSFLFAIGILVSLLGKTGGATAFARSLTKKLKSAKMVENAIIPLSIVLGLDDYLNTLTVAYVVRPLTDLFKIPRAKLAYLVQSMAGPLVILVPLSSWAAMISGQLELAGVSTNQDAKILADPFFVYLKSIPFIFFSLLVIASVWFIIQYRISFGPMREHELIAHQTGNLYAGKPSLHEEKCEILHESGDLSDVLVPLITLLVCVFVGIAWSGNYYLFGGNNSLLEAFKYNNKTSLVLFCSSVITLCIGFTQGILKKHISFLQIPQTIVEGIQLMYSPIFVVFLASLLGIILRLDLNTGSYLAHALLGSVQLYLFPLMIFVTSTIVSLAIGSAWGTISLMLPITIPMFLTFAQISTNTPLKELPLLFPILGAVFSGAVVGDLVSPVSGAAIMASSSSGCYPLDHTTTQFVYTIPAFIGTILAFLIAGLYATQTSLLFTNILAGFVGLIACFGLLYALNKKK